MTKSSIQITFSERAIKFGLWCLRRPIPMWFVLLYGVWIFATPVLVVAHNWQDVMFYFGPAKLLEILPAPVICLVASILAFCLRRESIAFLLIYFLLYIVDLFRYRLDVPATVKWTGIATQVILGGLVLWYLVCLKRKGNLR